MIGPMTSTVTFAERAEVEAALDDPGLVPPAPPASIGEGATARLRAAMARFGSGPDHAERRGAVVAALGKLVPADLRAAAARLTASRLTGGRIDAIADLGLCVPIRVLAAALDPSVAAGDVDDVDRLADDVRRVVEVIGHGEPADALTDAAADRLLRRFANHPAGAVPVVSILYQAHDATSALLATTIVARHTAAARRSAVSRTLRTAVADTVVAGTPVAIGTRVVLDLDATALELGAGPHRCPGFDIAGALVDGIVDTLDARRYELLADEVPLADQPPTLLPIAPTGSG